MRPSVASGLRIAPSASGDEDQTGWLVTFSDLVLQLFAFVLMATVLGGRTPTAQTVPMPPTEAAPAVAAESPLPSAPPHRTIAEDVAPRETVEEVVRTLVPPHAVEPVEPPAPPESQPASDLERAGALIERVVAASGHADSVSVQVTPRDVVLTLNDAIGFPSGRTDLGPDAAGILREVVRITATLPDVRVDVVGHTDDRPIHTAQFPSNLELSLARAARVAHELGAIDPRLVARTFAAGAGAERPLVPNDGPAGRARNRRVDIRLVPSERPPAISRAEPTPRRGGAAVA